MTVDYATADGTATAPSDYDAASGTLTFAAGQTSKTVTVTVNGDTLDEANETFNVNLTNPTNATIADSQGSARSPTTTRRPTISIDNVDRHRGQRRHEPTPLHRHPGTASGQTVTVDYATADGTATRPADYTATPDRDLRPGDTTKGHRPVHGDTLDEAERDVHAQPVERGQRDDRRRTGVGTITDDDAPPTSRSNDVTVTEGNTGTTQRDLHRHASTAQRPDRHRRLRDRRRHRDGARRLHARPAAR